MIIVDFKNLTKIHWKEIEENTIICYPEVGDFCYYPYPDHPNGCPNKDKCDHLNIPDFNTIQECANFKYFYLVYAEVDFKKYKELRELENPDFFNTPRKIANLLYWQKSVKSLLIRSLEDIKRQNNNYYIYVFGCGYRMKLSFQDRVGSMENSCINVFSTMKLNDIKFEVKPKDKVILCCLICSYEKLKIKELRQANIFDYLPSNKINEEVY